MAHRFQFNRKNHESVVVEGIRVDLGGGIITVVGEDGQPLVSFEETELSNWYRLHEDPPASV